MYADSITAIFGSVECGCGMRRVGNDSMFSSQEFTIGAEIYTMSCPSNYDPSKKTLIKRIIDPANAILMTWKRIGY